MGLDTLSLVFLGCMAFSGAYLLLTNALGFGHAHGVHVGHQLGGHAGAHAGAHGAGHTGAHAPAQNGAHAPHAPHAAGQGAGSATGGANGESPVAFLGHALLGLLNVYGVVLFLLIFGAVGFTLHALGGVGALLTLVVALAGALAGAVFAIKIIERYFGFDAANELAHDSSRLEGRIGEVSMPIRAGGIGEIIFTREGSGRQSVGARSADGAAIATGAEVVILGYRDGLAEVQPWDAFMAQVRAGHAPLLEPIE